MLAHSLCTPPAAAAAASGSVVLEETFRDTTSYLGSGVAVPKPGSAAAAAAASQVVPTVLLVEGAFDSSFNALAVLGGHCSGSTPSGACCLDVDNWKRTAGAAVGTSSCNAPNKFPNGVGNQRWSYDPATKQLTDEMNKFCLYVRLSKCMCRCIFIFAVRVVARG
jgi:hypothetical protein